jgi:hypothetical protein
MINLLASLNLLEKESMTIPSSPEARDPIAHRFLRILPLSEVQRVLDRTFQQIHGSQQIENQPLRKICWPP